MSVCKICLYSDPDKDLSQLKFNENADQSGEYILLFCLGIQVSKGSGDSTKFCEICFTKLAEFHQFKSLALKNEATLSSLGLQKYIENDLKSEVSSQKSDDGIYDEPLIYYSEPQEHNPLEELPSLTNNEPVLELPITLDFTQKPIDIEPSPSKKRKSGKIISPKKPKSSENAPATGDVSKQSKTKYELDRQLETHKTEEQPNILACAKCNKMFTSKGSLKDHLDTHIPKEKRKKIECDHCNRRFLYLKTLIRHLKIKHATKYDSQKFKCTLCNKIFMMKINLEKHLQRHELMKENKIFFCASCNEVCISKKRLQSHIMKTHPEQLSAAFKANKIFPCNMCAKRYCDQKNLKDHVKVAHAGKAQCPICKKQVKESYLQAHISTRHENENLPYQCDICNRKFIRKSLLKRHVTVHTGDKPFSCDLCNTKFRLKYSVALHKAQVHDKVKNHICHICSKRYFTSSLLQRHLKTHDPRAVPGVKPKKIRKAVTCPDCGKPLASKESMKNHRLLHKAQKISCEICGLAFATRDYVRKHMKTHLQIKKYTCKFCGSSFVRSTARRRHELEIHIKAGEKKPPRKDTRKNRIRKKKAKKQVTTESESVRTHSQELGPELPFKIEEFDEVTS